jgi:hypothetical protein
MRGHGEVHPDLIQRLLSIFKHDINVRLSAVRDGDPSTKISSIPSVRRGASQQL